MEGKWLWMWKDWIDRRFMKSYLILPDLEEMGFATMSPVAFAGVQPAIAQSTVSRVLTAIYQRQVARAQKLGYGPPPPYHHAETAVLPLPSGGGGAIITTMNYFRESVTDTYLFGKIVAVHSLNAMHAMGAKAQTALTLVVVPVAADEAVTESILLQLLAGVSDILQDEGVRLISGHICGGLELSCGLSVQAYTPDPDRPLRKRGGRVGDMLVLTKPIGTGALFAADALAKCRGEFLAEALEMATISNGPAGRVASSLRAVHACTAVADLGLIGHLLEVLMASGTGHDVPSICAALRIRDIPFLRGGLEASSNGIFSSLQSQNFQNRCAIVNHSDAAKAFPVEYPLLFDPQTAGGLLFFVDSEEYDEFLLLLQAEKITATVIGKLENSPFMDEAPLSAVADHSIRIVW
jgi:selenide,water dikinase